MLLNRLKHLISEQNGFNSWMAVSWQRKELRSKGRGSFSVLCSLYPLNNMAPRGIDTNEHYNLKTRPPFIYTIIEVFSNALYHTVTFLVPAQYYHTRVNYWAHNEALDWFNCVLVLPVLDQKCNLEVNSMLWLRHRIMAVVYKTLE